MTLATTQDMLKKAQLERFSVVGFAAYNLETVQTLVATAERLRAPLMIQTTPGTIDHAGIEYLSAIVNIAARKATIPVALHLDHGESMERVRACLAHGYTSIMIDGSHLPYEENVGLVKEVVAMAHREDVGVEAELGRIGGVEDELSVDEREARYTDPDMAQDFVARTGIDSLAIAIGTAHGMYKGEPQLDLDLLSTISQRVSIPLVLHGASGLPDALIRETIRRGIAKMNIATELKIPFAEGLRAYLHDHPDESDPRKYFRQAQQAYGAVVEEKIRLAGAQGRY